MKNTNRSRLIYIFIFASFGFICCVLLAGVFIFSNLTTPANLQSTSTNAPSPTLVPSPTDTPYPTSIGITGSGNKTIYFYINVYAEKSNLPIEKARIMVDGYDGYAETDKNGYIETYFEIQETEQFITLIIMADGFSPVTQRIETPYNKDIDYEADIYLPDEGILPPPPPASETPTFASITALPTTSSTPFILETPNSTQTIAAAFEEANRQFENLPSSSIAFNKPEKIKRNETTTIELILNPSKSEEAIATQLIEQSDFVTSTAEPGLLLDSNGSSVSVETSSIEITPLMKAELRSKSPGTFEIEAVHDDPVQVVGLANTTTWRWNVKALKEGPQTLELTIYQLVKYNGEENWSIVQTYDADIVVEVTPLERVKSLDWKWIFSSALALVGSILGVLGYLNNRKKQAEEEKPIESPKKKKK